MYVHTRVFSNYTIMQNIENTRLGLSYIEEKKYSIILLIKMRKDHK